MMMILHDGRDLRDGGALVWRALADPSRRKLLDLLKEQPGTTGELCEFFEFSRFAVMKHLRVLQHANLVIAEPRGRERLNHLNPIPIQQIYERWIRPYQVISAERILRLKAIVENP